MYDHFSCAGKRRTSAGNRGVAPKSTPSRPKRSDGNMLLPSAAWVSTHERALLTTHPHSPFKRCSPITFLKAKVPLAWRDNLRKKLKRGFRSTDREDSGSGRQWLRSRSFASAYTVSQLYYLSVLASFEVFKNHFTSLADARGRYGVLCTSNPQKSLISILNIPLTIFTCFQALYSTIL